MTKWNLNYIIIKLILNWLSNSTQWESVASHLGGRSGKWDNPWFCSRYYFGQHIYNMLENTGQATRDLNFKEEDLGWTLMARAV